MRILADEHVPPAIVAALEAEDHDVVIVGEAVDLGSGDRTILEYARDTDRVVRNEDADVRGGDPALTLDTHPGVLACDTDAQPGRIAAAVHLIDEYAVSLTDSVCFVPGEWL